MQIRCLAPSYEIINKEGVGNNESSMVLLLEKGDFQMLFTGDVEGEGEEELTRILEKTGVSDSFILKVAHHGSKNSTSESFLNVANPRISIISCGKNNWYGHPHEETLFRLYNSKSDVYVTKDCGAVKVEVNKKSIRIIPFNR